MTLHRPRPSLDIRLPQQRGRRLGERFAELSMAAAAAWIVFEVVMEVLT